MSSFAQTLTGDLDLSTGGLRIETGVAQCTAWKLSNLFGLIKGEWFMDLRIGLPLLQSFLVKNPNLNLLISIINDVIVSAPGVATVTGIDLTYAAGQRTLTGNFSAQTNDGAVLVGGLGAPFIVAQS